MKKSVAMALAMQMAMMPSDTVFELRPREALGYDQLPRPKQSKHRRLLGGHNSANPKKREHKDRNKKGRP